MAGSNDFALNISNFVKRSKLAVNQVIRKVTMDVSASLIMKTPVDTGRARGNWIIGMGHMDTSESPEKKDKEGDATQAAAQAAIADYDVFTGPKSIFVTNSVPYIKPLEYGHSKKQPNGMVRVTVAEFAKIAQDAINTAKQ